MMESVREELEEAAQEGQPELVDKPAGDSSSGYAPTVTPGEPVPQQSEPQAEGRVEANTAGPPPEGRLWQDDEQGSQGAQMPAQARQTGDHGCR